MARLMLLSFVATLPLLTNQTNHGGIPMLVLTRKASEQIMIGNDITVTITRIEGGQVRVGIDAPSEILIRRAELVTQWEEEAPTTSRAFR